MNYIYKLTLYVSIWCISIICDNVIYGCFTPSERFHRAVRNQSLRPYRCTQNNTDRGRRGASTSLRFLSPLAHATREKRLRIIFTLISTFIQLRNKHARTALWYRVCIYGPVVVFVSTMPLLKPTRSCPGIGHGGSFTLARPVCSRVTTKPLGSLA